MRKATYLQLGQRNLAALLATESVLLHMLHFTFTLLAWAVSALLVLHLGHLIVLSPRAQVMIWPQPSLPHRTCCMPRSGDEPGAFSRGLVHMSHTSDSGLVLMNVQCRHFHSPGLGVGPEREDAVAGAGTSGGGCVGAAAAHGAFTPHIEHDVCAAEQWNVHAGQSHSLGPPPAAAGAVLLVATAGGAVYGDEAGPEVGAGTVGCTGGAAGGAPKPGETPAPAPGVAGGPGYAGAAVG